VELILIRHGRPERVDFDPDGANPALTELGHAQAKLMADYLASESISELYVSPQQRAIDTAAPLAEATGLSPTIVDGIAEFDLGQPTYIPGEEAGPLSDDELNELLAELRGEPFVTRVLNSIGKIIESHPGEKVAAVCHGGVISTVLVDILGVSDMPYFGADYTSVTRIKASQSGTRTMTSFNECHWLRDLG